MKARGEREFGLKEQSDMSVGWARGLEGGGRKGVVMKDEAEEVKNHCKPSTSTAYF